MTDPTAEIATLKETVKGLNREIRDLKLAHKETNVRASCKSYFPKRQAFTRSGVLTP